MPIAILQENGALTTTASTTESITLNVGIGNALHILATSGGSNTVTLSLADGINAYSAPLNTITNSSQRASQFVANGLAGGSTTITVTSTLSSTAFLGLWVREIGFTSGLDVGKTNSLFTSAAVTTTNGLTGTAITPSAAPGLISSFALWMSGTSNFANQAAIAGTAFAAGSPITFFGIPNNIAASESLRYLGPPASQQALWTVPAAGSGFSYGVWSALFVETIVPPSTYLLESTEYF